MKGIALLGIIYALIVSCPPSQKAGEDALPQDALDEDAFISDAQPDFTPEDFLDDKFHFEVGDDTAPLDSDLTSDSQDIKFEDNDDAGDNAPDIQQDTGDDCQKLFTAYFEEAAKLDFCSAPGQCKHIKSEICVQNKGCAGFLINETASTDKLEQIAALYKSLGCPLLDETCECPAIDFAASGCYESKCQPCGYICNLDCTCKKDLFGCDLPECEEDVCVEVIEKIEAEVEQLKACQGTFDCSLFEYPICDSAGCFQTAVLKEGDYTELFNLAEQAAQLQCSGFTCGCGYSGMPICIDGMCAKCPPDCEGSCEGITKALKDLFPTVNECNFSAECYPLDTSYCDLGFGCYFAPVSMTKDITVFDELSAVYSKNNCSKIACKCLPPPEELFCIEHRCTAEFSCEQLLGEIDALFKSQKSTWCNSDADCKFVYAEKFPFCGDACDCHIAVNKNYEEEAWTLIETAHKNGCFTENMPTCECFAADCEEIPTPKCDNGVCK